MKKVFIKPAVPVLASVNPESEKKQKAKVKVKKNIKKEEGRAVLLPSDLHVLIHTVIINHQSFSNACDFIEFCLADEALDKKTIEIFGSSTGDSLNIHVRNMIKDYLNNNTLEQILNQNKIARLVFYMSDSRYSDIKSRASKHARLNNFLIEVLVKGLGLL